MPRDSSGNYSLPAENPVVDGTTIATTWANPTMEDIANQLNNVLTRDGLLAPTAPFYAQNGSRALPGLSFGQRPNSGLWNEVNYAGWSFNGIPHWASGSPDLMGILVNLAVNKTLTLGNAFSTNPFAALDVEGSTKGILLPRLTSAQKHLIPNAVGMTVYDTDLRLMSYNDGNVWQGVGNPDNPNIGPQGPQGPEGEQGPQGVPGPEGPQGIKGDTGDQGLSGAATAIVGEFGVSKNPGDLPVNGFIPADWDSPGSPAVDKQMIIGESLTYVGPDDIGLITNDLFGFVGTGVAEGWLNLGQLTGPQGEQGAQGAQGPKGDTGSQGPAGIQGPTGAQGTIGPQGPQGVQGIEGEVGPAGTTAIITGEFGDPASGSTKVPADLPPSGFIPANWDHPGSPAQDIQFEQGWAVIYQGPDSGTDHHGDLFSYVTTIEHPAGWVNVGAIKGPQGDTGPQGIQGIQGPKGDQGTTGSTGQTGPEGPIGPQGIQGVQGPQGEQGTQGPAGTTATLIGSFGDPYYGSTRIPTDLPPDGLIPANWDHAGYPANDYQMRASQALVYQGADGANWKHGDLYSYVTTVETPTGWVNVGAIKGPQGDTGPQGPQGIQGETGPQGDPGADNGLSPDGTGAYGIWPISVTGHASLDLALTGGVLSGDLEISKAGYARYHLYITDGATNQRKGMVQLDSNGVHIGTTNDVDAFVNRMTLRSDNIADLVLSNFTVLQVSQVGGLLYRSPGRDSFQVYSDTTGNGTVWSSLHNAGGYTSENHYAKNYTWQTALGQAMSLESSGRLGLARGIVGYSSLLVTPYPGLGGIGFTAYDETSALNTPFLYQASNHDFYVGGSLFASFGADRAFYLFGTRQYAYPGAGAPFEFVNQDGAGFNWYVNTNVLALQIDPNIHHHSYGFFGYPTAGQNYSFYNQNGSGFSWYVNNGTHLGFALDSLGSLHAYSPVMYSFPGAGLNYTFSNQNGTGYVWNINGETALTQGMRLDGPGNLTVAGYVDGTANPSYISRGSIGAVDWNTVTVPGVYQANDIANGTTNAPSALMYGYGQLTVTKATSFTVQTYRAHVIQNSLVSANRLSYEGTWEPWTYEYIQSPKASVTLVEAIPKSTAGFVVWNSRLTAPVNIGEANGLITIQVAGRYKVSAVLASTRVGAGWTNTVTIYKNGSASLVKSQTRDGGNTNDIINVVVDGIFDCDAGNTFQIYTSAESGPATVSGGSFSVVSV